MERVRGSSFALDCMHCIFIAGKLLQALESLCGSVVEAFGSALFEVRGAIAGFWHFIEFEILNSSI